VRIIINFSKNTEPVPTDNQKDINSYIHKCLGRNNEYHDAKSNYNISMLLGSSFNENAFEYSNGGKIIVSTKDIDLLNTLLFGVVSNPNLKWGMKYTNIDFVNEYIYDGVNHFFTLSPILVKVNLGDSQCRYVTIGDADFDEILTERTIAKLQAISIEQGLKLNLKGFQIISANNGKGKTMKVAVKNVVNMASHTILSVKSNKRVAELIYNLGLGQSTGSGFGCVCNVENIGKYKNTK
jgi:CRISPR-associated endoribonuclease Cas6